jgi:hypothetical protein
MGSYAGAVLMMFDADFWRLARMYFVRNAIVMVFMFTVFIWLLEVTSAVPHIHVRDRSGRYDRDESAADTQATKFAPQANQPHDKHTGEYGASENAAVTVDLSGFSDT